MSSLAVSHTLHVLDHTGDTAVMWSPTDDELVRIATEEFNKVKAKGYLTYKADADGQNREVIHEFDESAPLIAATPAFQGG